MSTKKKVFVILGSIFGVLLIVAGALASFVAKFRHDMKTINFDIDDFELME